MQIDIFLIHADKSKNPKFTWNEHFMVALYLMFYSIIAASRIRLEQYTKVLASFNTQLILVILDIIAQARTEEFFFRKGLGGARQFFDICAKTHWKSVLYHTQPLRCAALKNLRLLI